MATNTTNYNLEKPSEDEFYDVGVQNANMDKIDTAIKAVNTKAESLGTGKVDKVTGKGLSTEDFTTAEQTKLQGIAANANNYVHPSSHPATMITEDTTHKFMTDAEQTKLQGIAANANNYVHPSSHPATMITEDTTHKFMTDAEQTKLQGIAANAQVNVLEGVTVNGVAVTIGSNKKSNIPVPAATTVVNNLTSTSTTAALSAAQGKVLKDLADGHIEKNINTVNGVHGIRYYDEVLSFWNGTAWVEIETGGGGGVFPGDVTGINIAPGSGSGQLEIKWTDPDDEYWYGTKVVMKAGSYPDDEGDGTVIVDSRVRNAYQSNAFTKSGLTNGTEYFFGFFPYSEAGAVNYHPENRGSGTPVACNIWGVQIDLSNSKPSSCITYTDDAVGMTPGSAAWDAVFNPKPCLFKNGAVVGYLNPANFAKFADGSSADITSGDDGDVMIEFPRMGLKISTSGNTLSIKMTDVQDHADFEYYAHTRGTARKEKFYLGAYKGIVDNNKLRSLSGKAITVDKTIGYFRTKAQANGTGYDQSAFYQLTFIQAMYLLKYKNLNSQTALGKGYTGATAKKNTGDTNSRGMCYGTTSDTVQVKLFGLEDFWGNVYEWIDGIFCNASRKILTATTSFNDTGSGYTNQGAGATADLSGYMKQPQGTSECGFLAKVVGGAETTYFCDSSTLCDGCVAFFGGGWADGGGAGAIRLGVSRAASDSSSAVAARLMYL